MSDEFDRLLDKALSAYVSAPDRPGLEERVLAHVNERKPRPRYWFVYASAAAAVIAGWLLIWPSRVAETPTPPRHISIAAAKSILPPVAPEPVPRPAAVPLKRPVRRHTEPQRPEFPTRLPLTPQERSLLEIAESQPAQLAALNRPMEPLEIPPIQIEPLEKGKN